MVALFGEKAVYGPCVLVGALWWLEWAIRKLSGFVCWSERSRRDLVARFGAKAVYGPCVLVGAFRLSLLVTRFG